MSGDREWKILQIIPAQTGWKAVYAEESEDREIKVSLWPIACWARVEEVVEDRNTPGIPRVRGMIQWGSDLVVVDHWIISDELDKDGRDLNTYFVGYRNPEQPEEDWIKTAEGLLELEQRKRRNEQRTNSANTSDFIDITAPSKKQG